jgi:hypothetical protein
MREKTILILDAAINFALGVLLLFFSPSIVSALGVPPAESNFYPNILGSVFVGITIALLVEAFRPSGSRTAGLGLFGAIAINLCGGGVLALWLIFGNLNLPAKGVFFLWSLVAMLIVLSAAELFHAARRR